MSAYLTPVPEPGTADGPVNGTPGDTDDDPDTAFPYGGGVTFPEIRLLGPVRLDGVTDDGDAAASARLTEIAAWIALHPDGDVGELARAVWPLGVPDTTRNSHVARLRRLLGTGTDGRHHLPPAAAGRLRLGPGVACDWTRFQELTAVHPRHGERAVADCTRALGLVRGEPMSRTLPRRFAWAEPWRHAMTAAVVDTSVRLGGHHFHHGDLAASRAAIDVGLSVCPESQMLHRGLFRILHRQGRIDELQDRIDRLDALLGEIGIEPEPKTVRLLEILLRVKTPGD